MSPLLILPLLAQLLVPLGLVGWLAFGRPRTRTEWGLAIVLAGLCIIAASVAGLWSLMPPFAAWILVALFLLATARSAGRVRHRRDWPAGVRDWVAVAARGALTLVVAVLAFHALSARRAPAVPVVDLAFPLAGGTYYVANGGSTELLNAHLATLHEERSRPWRGQSHGVDLLKVNRWGVRAAGILPGDPERYLIFGDEVVAPCIGTVIAATDGLSDLSPPRIDREHMAGNHVILECGAVWVVLAHLREGSVCVRPGDAVRTGQRIGEVGNSGNTTEPHLHIHAQRAGTADAPMSGDPLVMRFAGRYLVRNDFIDPTK